jgi:hypothetical protein
MSRSGFFWAMPVMYMTPGKPRLIPTLAHKITYAFVLTE